MKRVVAVNEKGCRIGEDHQRAKLSNHEVELIVKLFEEGWSCRMLAEKFDVTYGMIGHIVRGARRTATPANYRTLKEQKA